MPNIRPGTVLIVPLLLDILAVWRLCVQHGWNPPAGLMARLEAAVDALDDPEIGAAILEIFHAMAAFDEQHDMGVEIHDRIYRVFDAMIYEPITPTALTNTGRIGIIQRMIHLANKHDVTTIELIGNLDGYDREQLDETGYWLAHTLTNPPAETDRYPASVLYELTRAGEIFKRSMEAHRSRQTPTLPDSYIGVPIIVLDAP